MASEITIERRVKHHYRAGQYCGRETEIVITLPQKDYRRLTRSLGWRSVHWPANRRGRPRKMREPEHRPPAETVEVRDPLTLPVSLADTPKNLDIQLPRLAAVAKRREKKPRAKRVSLIACSPFAIAHTDPAVPCLMTLVNKPPMHTLVAVEACEVDMYVPQAVTPPAKWSPVHPAKSTKKPLTAERDLLIPAPEAAALEKPPAKPRGRPRVPERDRFVEPDVSYVLQTLREMLAVAEQKEAYHAAALRAVQGPRVAQKRRAFAILPLLRKECIRPLQKAIKRLESLEKKQ